MEETDSAKRGRGRPVERPIEPLPATPEEIRDAIFRAADCSKSRDGTEAETA